MATKDKGSRNTTKVAAEGLKEKRLEENMKRSAAERMANQLVGRPSDAERSEALA